MPIMSRCLVESIKLQGEKVVAKTEEKKEMKLKKVDDGLNRYKAKQSDLTEEHEPPVCYLYDGHKRKRESPSSSECRVNGDSIRIWYWISLADSSDLSKEPVCSTSGRAECSQGQHCPLKRKENIFTPVTEMKVLRSGSSVHDNKMHKAALQYKALIEGLVQLPRQVYNHYDIDEDWLFTSKQRGQPLAKRSKLAYDVTFRDGAASCPRACFLPDAGIYALPYAVPI